MLRNWVIISTVVFLAGCEIPNVIDSKPTSTPLRTALEYRNKHEDYNRFELKEFVGVDPSTTEWCAAFVNAVLNENNIPGSESVSEHPLMARSFLSWGKSVKQPLKGDIVVFNRDNSNWQGHVGFYIMTSSDEKYYYILGGNQSDSVTIEAFPVSEVLGIRRIDK